MQVCNCRQGRDPCTCGKTQTIQSPWFAPKRPPDFFIGRADGRYLLRWYIFRSRLFSIYLHQTLRSDSEVALHDHPWANLSIVLSGGYAEVRRVSIRVDGKIWDIEKQVWCPPGTIIFRRRGTPHRLVLPLDGKSERSCWSLFITFWKHLDPDGKPHWGFHCPKGWKRFDQMVKYDEKTGESLPAFDCDGGIDHG